MGDSDRLRRALAGAMALSLLSPSAPIAGQASATSGTPDTARAARRQPYQAGQLQGDERILHALNRFTFGTRPGDLEAVRSTGLETWFAQQLHPDTIDNSTLEAHLADFPAMQRSPQDLLYRLPSNGIIRQAVDGKVPIPASGAEGAIYRNEIARYENRQQQKAQQKQQVAALANNAAMPGAALAGQSGSSQAIGTDAGMASFPQSAGAIAATEQMRSMEATRESAGETASSRPEEPTPDQAQIARVLLLAPAPRVARLAAMPQAELDSFRKALKGPQRLQLVAGLDPAQKEFLAALENPQRVVADELTAERLTRDIYSNAQLQEVMTDFWLNHFNVYLHKNDETPYYLVSYERDVIGPRALGKFEDLLEATAHSPAMLLYLDNSSSIGPDSPAAERAKIAAARRPDKKTAPEGLNENYARELMELHTLGVNGGYTQADVTQVARVLTGWTVDQPGRGGAFKFDDNRHEPGTKKVLGKKIKEHGEQEGRELLHMLATRPATARFISRKLAIRFVGDDPPQALVDRMAKTYLSSSGDISAVLKTLFHSAEFWAPDAYRAKIKTPIEFVASAARASNASIDNMQPLVNALRDMGMPLYGAVPPTGYKWEASDWVSTGALVNRMNFALTLAANKLQGVAINWRAQAEAAQDQSPVTRVDDGTVTRSFAQPDGASATLFTAPTPESEEQRLETLLVAGGVGSSTRAAVLDQFSSQIQAQNAQTEKSARPVTAAARPVNPAQAANALERQDQLLAGLLLGSPEFQRR
ncbi:MAG: DUF1800 domain-containing protein [Terracidiphilus sp.]